MKDSKEYFSKEEIQKEAEDILAEVLESPSVTDIKATEEMHESLMEKVDACEQAQYQSISLQRIFADQEKEARDISAQEELETKGKTVSYRKSKKIKTKLYLILAATMVLVLGIGITSVGGKQYLTDTVDRMLGGREQISVDSQEILPMEGITEEQAFEDIKKQLGFDVVTMDYKPEGMSFESAQVSQELKYAELLYNYQGYLVTYMIKATYSESSYGVDVEDFLRSEYDIKVENVRIHINEYQIAEGNELKYVAQYEYKNIQYTLIATMKKTEFEKILKNLYFF
ncbi:MAG: DUF4367 domain-containing protein [Lachnospiraceae bacterium]